MLIKTLTRFIKDLRWSVDEKFWECSTIICFIIVFAVTININCNNDRFIQIGLSATKRKKLVTTAMASKECFKKNQFYWTIIQLYYNYQYPSNRVSYRYVNRIYADSLWLLNIKCMCIEGT